MGIAIILEVGGGDEEGKKFCSTGWARAAVRRVGLFERRADHLLECDDKFYGLRSANFQAMTSSTMEPVEGTVEFEECAVAGFAVEVTFGTDVTGIVGEAGVLRRQVVTKKYEGGVDNEIIIGADDDGIIRHAVDFLNEVIMIVGGRLIEFFFKEVEDSKFDSFAQLGNVGGAPG